MVLISRKMGVWYLNWLSLSLLTQSKFSIWNSKCFVGWLDQMNLMRISILFRCKLYRLKNILRQAVLWLSCKKTNAKKQRMAIIYTHLENMPAVMFFQALERTTIYFPRVRMSVCICFFFGRKFISLTNQNFICSLRKKICEIKLCI